MTDIKWIKIATDIFEDDKILMLETLENSESIILIWIKLLCLAGKNNNGGVFMLGKKPYTTRTFATVFRMPEELVKIALAEFEALDMIEMINGTVTIPKWDKHQSIDAYEKKKEYDRQYRAEKRAMKKEEKSRTTSNDSSYDPSYEVVSRIEENRIEKNREEEIRIEKNRIEKNEESASGTNEPCGSLVSPEGDIAADAASSADAEQSNKVDFSFSSASAEQPTQNSYSAPSAAPKMDKGDISANMPRVDKTDAFATMPRASKPYASSDAATRADKGDISAAAPMANRSDASVAAAPRTYNGNKPTNATSGNKPNVRANAAPRAYNPDTFFEMPKAGEDAPRFDNLVPEEYTKDPEWENYLTDARESLRQIFGAPKPPKKTDTKPRYGSFDPEEAMAIAIARTEYEFDKTDKNKSS